MVKGMRSESLSRGPSQDHRARCVHDAEGGNFTEMRDTLDLSLLFPQMYFSSGEALASVKKDSSSYTGP